MPIRNYYFILGVGRDDTPRRIRDAYLSLAKKHHPDRAGEREKEAFQHIQKAYETLSDPEKRRLYNDQLDQAKAEWVSRAAGGAATPVSVPVSIYSRPESVWPSFEALHERWLRNFTRIGAPKGERVEGLNIEVVLTAEEAARGGIAPIEVPSYDRCPFCDGTGYEWAFPCTFCFAEGVVEKTETIRVEIAPFVKPGSIFEIPLHGLGIHNFYLRLHVFIE